MALLGTATHQPWACGRGAPLALPCWPFYRWPVHLHVARAPGSGIQVQQQQQQQQQQLRLILYADDICLMADSPERVQALLDALALYFHIAAQGD